MTPAETRLLRSYQRMLLAQREVGMSEANLLRELRESDQTVPVKGDKVPVNVGTTNAFRDKELIADNVRVVIYRQLSSDTQLAYTILATGPILDRDGFPGKRRGKNETLIRYLRSEDPIPNEE